MSDKYLEMLQNRIASKSRPISRVPLCLDPERYEQLHRLRKELKAAEEAENNFAQKPTARKMSEANPVAVLKKQVEDAEAYVREASVNVVLQGRTQGEIVDGLVSAAGKEGEKKPLTDEQRFGIIADAFLRLEDLEGATVAEITKERFAELLPTLTSGEITTLYRGINVATESPAFPTLRRS